MKKKDAEAGRCVQTKPCATCKERTDETITSGDAHMHIHRGCCTRGTDEVGMFLRRVGTYAWPEPGNEAAREPGHEAA